MDTLEDQPPLRVAVLVDLMLRPDAGGHVKCWERFAEAAAGRDGRDLDLTVHFQGAADEVRPLATHVRHHLHRPVLSTARLPFLSHVPDHADLAPWHPGIAAALASADVIHTTDGLFAFARTARRIARRRGRPLVSSTHTNTPAYARLHTAETVRRLFGRGPATRLLLDRLHVDQRTEHRMDRRLAAYLSACDAVLLSDVGERPVFVAGLPAERLHRLRRGIDLARFNPALGDRGAVAARYGIPLDVPLILFAGRLGPEKNILTLAEALGRLKERGVAFHLLAVGHGSQRAAVEAILGDAATLPGQVSLDDLAWLHPSADLFAFPSEYETVGNVLREAMASGTAVAISASCAGDVIRDGVDGVVLPPFASPAEWADALGPLLADRRRLAAMGAAARARAESCVPTWDDVLAEDLLPVWRAVARVTA